MCVSCPREKVDDGDFFIFQEGERMVVVVALYKTRGSAVVSSRAKN